MLAWRIALRYLVSKKSHGAVNVISIISVAGVAVATAAIVIVLSVFNGFTALSEAHMSAIDPDVKLEPVSGKTFADADSLCAAASAVEGVAAAMPMIEERALLISGNQQMPVVMMGVTDSYGSMVSIDSIVIDGTYAQGRELDPYEEVWLDGRYPMLASVGVAINAGARPMQSSRVGLYVPRRVGRINPANPQAAFRGEDMAVTGVFEVKQPEYDASHVIVPIEAARSMLEYDTEATCVAVMLQPGASQADAIAELRKALGPDVRVLDRYQQEESSYKMIMIEKWVTFLMLAFILVIASFNIISTLSILVIEKRDNMATLRTLGAGRRLVRNVFIYQGILISVVGGVCGIVLGTVLTLAQQWGGFIKLSGDPAQLTIDTYPVRLLPADLLAVLGLVAVVAIITSQVTRLFTLKTSRI